MIEAPRTLLLAGCGKLGVALASHIEAQADAEGWELWGLRRRPDALPSAIHPWAADLVAPEGLTPLPAHFTHVIYTATPPRYDEAAYMADLGVKATRGEVGYTVPERKSIRPTLDVNGIWGGYTGEGSKTVLPSEAHAKISMRLVPNQDSEEIARLFTQHIHNIAPESVQVKVVNMHGGEAAVTPIDSTGYQAASKAYETAFGKTPIPTRDGGSIPIVALFQHTLNLDTILMGFGLNSDNIHSPNEHYGLFNYYKGIETIAYFHQIYAEMMKNPG